MIEADIIAYLDPSIDETVDVDIFEGPLPEAPANCVAVDHYNSQPSDDYEMSPSLTAPGSELEDFQIAVRNTSRATARTKANAIHVLLDNLGPVTLSGRVYSQVTSDGPPFCLKQDEGGRWHYVANYHARKARG
jgi:hypothetical protein